MSAATFGGLVLLAAACERPYPFSSDTEASVPLRITTWVVGTPIALVVVEATGGGIPTRLVFTFSVVNLAHGWQQPSLTARSAHSVFSDA